jgi:hypothetical protein
MWKNLADCILICVGIGIVLNPASVKAQTAEETVLFMLFGYEKDSNPLGLVNVSAVKVTNCKYDVMMSYPEANIRMTFDFEKMKEYAVVRGALQNTVRPVAYGAKWIHFRATELKTGKVLEGDGDSLEAVGKAPVLGR